MDARPTLLTGLHAYGSALDAGTGTSAGAVPAVAPPGRMLAALYVCEPYRLEAPGLPVARLSVNLTDSAVSGGLEGDRDRRYEARRGSLFLTPAGAGARWHKASRSRHINLYFDPQDETVEGRGASVGHLLGSGVPLFNVTLRASAGVVASLEQELREPDDFSAEAIDSLGRLLLIALARGQRPAPDACGLSSAELKRLSDYVRAHLAQRLLVADLAAVVGLPPSRFAEAFLRSTGRTPHQFVLSQRLALACELLEQGQLAISEVALSAGFSSQSHLTRLLRSRLGATPAQLQRSRRLA